MSLSNERRKAIEDYIVNEIGRFYAGQTITQKEIAKKTNLSIQSVSKLMKKMEQSQRIIKHKNGRKNIYSLPEQATERTYSLEGLTEHKVYKEMVVDFIQNVPVCAKENFQYAFLEMMNNAIEHSAGTKVTVQLKKNEYQIEFAISDDGIGIYTKIADALKLEEKSYAILELAKGKFTTDPESHTGEGIFFSSKCGCLFGLISDEIVFMSNPGNEVIVEEQKQFANKGTMVLFKINLQHKEALKDLFDKYTDAPESYGFSKTIIPIHLLEYGDKSPIYISRSQARRLLIRVERFNVVKLDFSGIETIGQGFADEVFRVFKNNHPHVDLIPINCSEAVDKMIKHVLAYQ
jgi:predicted transcriptional regulator